MCIRDRGKTASSIKYLKDGDSIYFKSNEDVRDIRNRLTRAGLIVDRISVNGEEDLEFKDLDLEAGSSSSIDAKESAGDDSIPWRSDEAGKVHYRAQFVLGSNENIDTIINVIKGKSLVTSINHDENNLFAIVPNKNICQDIINVVRDHNISIQLKDILPVHTEKKYKVTASIGGITCAACASSITNAVSDLDFVSDVAVNVVSKVGVFILDSDAQSKLCLLYTSRCV